jgi:hypothetical protein
MAVNSLARWGEVSGVFGLVGIYAFLVVLPVQHAAW